MRIAFALICLVFIGAVTGAGIRAIDAAREMSTRQQLELDGAIDRIVAEHKERREAALLAAAMTAFDETPNRSSVQADRKGEGAKETTKETIKEAGQKAAKPGEPKSSRTVAVASPQKNQRPRVIRSVSRNNVLIPQAFVSLPKFSAAALLGWR